MAIAPTEEIQEVKAVREQSRLRDTPAEDRPVQRENAASTAVDEKSVKQALDQFGSTLVVGNRSIEFGYDEDAAQVVITVRSVDGKTGDESKDIVRQIPPDYYLKFTSQLRELFGVVFDETV